MCCVTGCHKGDSQVTNGNALVIKPEGNGKAIEYPIGSVFQGGSDLGDWAALHYNFFREKYTEYPRKVNPIISIGGVMYSSVQYTEPGQWIGSIVIQGIDESLGFGSRIAIPMEQGTYKGGNELIQDVRIISFRSPDIRIVITTAAGDTITIRYSDDVLFDGMC